MAGECCSIAQTTNTAMHMQVSSTNDAKSYHLCTLKTQMLTAADTTSKISSSVERNLPNKMHLVSTHEIRFVLQQPFTQAQVAMLRCSMKCCCPCLYRAAPKPATDSLSRSNMRACPLTNAIRPTTPREDRIPKAYDAC